MTRVNLVDPQNLADQHLFAEWREIKMVPAALRRSLKTRSKNSIIAGIPKSYTLNTGHVTFFFDKMSWLANRYVELECELISRSYDLADHSTMDIFFKDIPHEFIGGEDWQPTASEIAINVERINLRLNEKPTWYKHYGSQVPPAYFAELYKLQLDRSTAIC